MKSLYIGSMLFLSLNLLIILLDSDHDSGTKHLGAMENFPSDKIKLIQNVKFSVFFSVFWLLTFSFLGDSYRNRFLIDSERVTAVGSVYKGNDDIVDNKNKFSGNWGMMILLALGNPNRFYSLQQTSSFHFEFSGMLEAAF